MKSISFIFSVLFILTGCSNEYAHEDDVCACYRKSMSVEGFDFDETLLYLETGFIEIGIIGGSTGQDYLNEMIDFVQTEEKEAANFTDEFIMYLKSLDDAEVDFLCFIEEFENRDNSKLKNYRNAFTSNPKTRQQNIEKIVNSTQSLVGAEGFKHPYYKAFYFKYYYEMTGIKETYFDYSLLPLKNEVPINAPSNDRERDVLDIVADAADALTVNGDAIQIGELYALVLNFYQANLNGNDNDAEAPFYVKIDSLICLEKIAELEINLTKDSTDRMAKSDLKKWQTKFDLVRRFESGFCMEISTSAHIKLKNDGGTTYGMYIEILNIIKRVVNELRVEKCEEMGWPDYFELDDKNVDDQEYIKMLRILVPERIIESRIERDK